MESSLACDYSCVCRPVVGDIPSVSRACLQLVLAHALWTLSVGPATTWLLDMGSSCLSPLHFARFISLAVPLTAKFRPLCLP